MEDRLKKFKNTYRYQLFSIFKNKNHMISDTITAMTSVTDFHKKRKSLGFIKLPQQAAGY